MVSSSFPPLAKKNRTGWSHWLIWFIWFVSFVWLNQTDQIDQMNQINPRRPAPLAKTLAIVAETLMKHAG
jgi:hypothetical protein